MLEFIDWTAWKCCFLNFPGADLLWLLQQVKYGYVNQPLISSSIFGLYSNQLLNMKYLMGKIPNTFKAGNIRRKLNTEK